MREAGGGPRLAAEALAGRLVLRGLGTDQLDRHPAVQALVVGLVDLPHAAGAEPFSESVRTDRLRADRHALCSLQSELSHPALQPPLRRPRAPRPWRRGRRRATRRRRSISSREVRRLPDVRARLDPVVERPAGRCRAPRRPAGCASGWPRRAATSSSSVTSSGLRLRFAWGGAPADRRDAAAHRSTAAAPGASPEQALGLEQHALRPRRRGRRSRSGGRRCGAGGRSPASRRRRAGRPAGGQPGAPRAGSSRRPALAHRRQLLARGSGGTAGRSRRGARAAAAGGSS